MNANIHASVAWGDRRLISSEAHASSTHTRYDPTKIWNHGNCGMDPSIEWAMLDTRIARHWDDEIVPQLIHYIRMPAKSPHFDPEWRRHGHIAASIAQARRWAEHQNIAGLKLEVIELEGRKPVLLFDAPASGSGASQKTVLLYGHLDKQPEMAVWRGDLGPWTPKLEQGRLYGRGG